MFLWKTAPTVLITTTVFFNHKVWHWRYLCTAVYTVNVKAAFHGHTVLIQKKSCNEKCHLWRKVYLGKSTLSIEVVLLVKGWNKWVTCSSDLLQECPVACARVLSARQATSWASTCPAAGGRLSQQSCPVALTPLSTCPYCKLFRRSSA